MEDFVSNPSKSDSHTALLNLALQSIHSQGVFFIKNNRVAVSNGHFSDKIKFLFYKTDDLTIWNSLKIGAYGKDYTPMESAWEERWGWETNVSKREGRGGGEFGCREWEEGKGGTQLKILEIENRNSLNLGLLNSPWTHQNRMNQWLWIPKDYFDYLPPLANSAPRKITAWSSVTFCSFFNSRVFALSRADLND